MFKMPVNFYDLVKLDGNKHQLKCQKDIVGTIKLSLASTGKLIDQLQ